jgi:hypothetical protein
MAWIMNANGIKWKLARKAGWLVAMSAAAYGIEAIWEGQARLFDGFHRLNVAIGRAVAGTFSTSKGEYIRYRAKLLVGPLAVETKLN